MGQNTIAADSHFPNAPSPARKNCSKNASHILTLLLNEFYGPFAVASESIRIRVLSLICLDKEGGIAILRRRFEPFQLFQFAASFLFGFYTDIAMMLTQWIPLGMYPLSWLWLIAGCAVMGAGIVLEIQASLLLLPGEGVVAAISKVGHWQFHTIKIINDVVMTLTGVIIAWVMIGGIEGVREGTVVSAFLVGFMVKLFKRPLQPVEAWVNR